MDLFKLLKTELGAPLPGRGYQLMMAPKHSREFPQPAAGYIDAAVALILQSSGDGIAECILIRRPDYDGPHSGQVSFPGGKADPADSSLYQTAVRETREEIGLGLLETEYAGCLTPLEIQISGFRIYPFVFYTSRSVDLQADPDEVRYLIHFNVSLLLDRSAVRTFRFKRGPYEFDAPFYAVGNEVVWGATSMILSEFAEILARIAKKNPGLSFPG